MHASFSPNQASTSEENTQMARFGRWRGLQPNARYETSSSRRPRGLFLDAGQIFIFLFFSHEQVYHDMPVSYLMALTYALPYSVISTIMQ